MTAVTLSDVLRLYFNMLDPRPYAVCSQAVGDMRRITMRAPANLTFSVLRNVLQMHGYEVKQKDGMVLICDQAGMSGSGPVVVQPSGDGGHVYSAQGSRTGALPPADTWGPPSAEQPGPLHPAPDAPGSAVAPIPMPEVPKVVRVYKPLWRSSGELLPIIAQTSLGRVLNVSAGGGAPSMPPPQNVVQGAAAAGVAGNFLQTTSDYVVWQGTDEEWAKLCPVLEQLDVPTPSVMADVYVFSVTLTNSDSDGISVVGKAAGLNFDVGSTRSNSIGIGVGGIGLALSSLRTRQDVRLVQHYSASLVNARQQLLNSGASVPIVTDVVDGAGGTTRQSSDYRPVGTSVTIQPRIMSRSVQLDMTIELSSVSTLHPGQNVNPTFNTEKVSTTVDARPGSMSFVSALSAASSSASKEKFFFVPLGRTKESQRSDIVYMIVLHDLDRTDEAFRQSTCEVAEDGPETHRSHRTGADSGPSSASPKKAAS